MTTKRRTPNSGRVFHGWLVFNDGQAVPETFATTKKEATSLFEGNVKDNAVSVERVRFNRVTDSSSTRGAW